MIKKKNARLSACPPSRAPLASIYRNPALTWERDNSAARLRRLRPEEDAEEDVKERTCTSRIRAITKSAAAVPFHAAKIRPAAEECRNVRTLLARGYNRSPSSGSESASLKNA